MTIKFMSDKLTETINRRKIEELSVSQFKQLINIFEMVKNWVTVELNHLMIDKDKEINIPSLKSLLNKYNSYFQKISTVSLINLQIEREKSFFFFFKIKKFRYFLIIIFNLLFHQESIINNHLF